MYTFNDIQTDWLYNSDMSNSLDEFAMKYYTPIYDSELNFEGWEKKENVDDVEHS